MNLHGVVGPIVSAVNPTVIAQLQVSTGTAVDPTGDGTRVPTYAGPVAVPAQIQALTFSDLRQIDGLGLNGTRRAIYLYGNVEGINRASGKGGDIITFPDSTVWLVALVLEAWPDWVKVAVTQQQAA